MVWSRLRAALPYAALLVLAGVLFMLADGIQYEHRPGQLGPDFWPKLAIGLMAGVCAVEIGRALFSPAVGEARGIADELEAAGDSAAEEAPRRLSLLLGGAALTVAYGALVPIFGFILSTFLYLVTFMYLGRYRSHGVILATSLIGTLFVAFVFLKVVYVSLPRGITPFDSLTDAFMSTF